MATVAEQQRLWGEAYDWRQAGDEWSSPWGSVAMQWYATLLPRLHAHLPAKTVLEIAPGYGRWTQFLQPLCERLIVVDLSERCIDACRQRFAHVGNIEYHVNDGRSLDFVPDRSIDFIFSFDSLVHADDDAVGAYLQAFSRKLTQNGKAFIHHSNLGAHQKFQRAVAACPYRIKQLLAQMGMSQRMNLHGRDTKMSAARFASLAEAAGLSMVSQELINWGGPGLLIDGISVVGASKSGPTKMLLNPDFATEIRNARRLSPIYAAGSPG
jgi:ubiquinone/menaquinone biosynthesis C-methylase UbiE